MISIVISTYNRPERLKKAIDSVLAQSFEDFEVIVVDDCSPDNTEEVVKGYSDPRVQYIKLAENFGNDTKPKNVGIAAAKGEYLAFLDDDNTWRPDHLAVLMAKMTKTPDCDLVYGDWWVVDEVNGKSGKGNSADFNPGLLFKRNFIDTSVVLVKKSAVMAVGGFDERYKKYVDWNLWLRLFKAGYNLTHTPFIITDYYFHQDMKSTRIQTEGDKKTGVNSPEWDPYSLEIHLPYLGEVKEPRVAIFSLTYDRLPYSKVCFESIRKTAGYPYHHFVLDQGSADGTAEWLKEYAATDPNNRDIVLKNENLGISRGSNYLLDVIGRDYDIIVKVDNDAFFLSEGWLAKMVEIWKANHRMILSCYVQGLRDNPGGAPRIGSGLVCGEMIGISKHLGGICVFADASVYKDFRWDNQDFLHSRQDVEFSQYATINGYQMGYLENYPLEHYKGTVGQEKDYPEYFERRANVDKVKRYGKN